VSPFDPRRGNALDARPQDQRRRRVVHQSKGCQRALELIQVRAHFLMGRPPKTIEHGRREIAEAGTAIDEQDLAQDPRERPAFLRILIAPAVEHARQPVPSFQEFGDCHRYPPIGQDRSCALPGGLRLGRG
jgi:hypothetical protein